MHLNLVEAARDGDHEAFEVLAAASVDRLYAIARLVLHDAHYAEGPCRRHSSTRGATCRDSAIRAAGTLGCDLSC